MAKDPIPTSRVVRSAKLGRHAAGQAVRQAGTRAANLTRDRDWTRAQPSSRHQSPVVLHGPERLTTFP